MKSLFFAAASAILLSACAGVQSSSTGATHVAQASPAGGTMYCWKRELERSGGNFVCNWEDSAREACRSNGAVMTLSAVHVAGEPRDSGRCENGEWLVALPTK